MNPVLFNIIIFFLQTIKFSYICPMKIVSLRSISLFKLELPTNVWDYIRTRTFNNKHKLGILKLNLKHEETSLSSQASWSYWVDSSGRWRWHRGDMALGQVCRAAGATAVQPMARTGALATGSLRPQGTVGSSFHVPAMKVNLLILFQSYSLFQIKFYRAHLAFFSNWLIHLIYWIPDFWAWLLATVNRQF